ncbi:hypothetical protein BGW80DRAFT_25772 [Lactifluus volemus]|nr:hypothetical protein BGW80DRAFT_25772 [Lactifluus volemus]
MGMPRRWPSFRHGQRLHPHRRPHPINATTNRPVSGMISPLLDTSVFLTLFYSAEHVELLAHCVQNNIKVFSSMGAGTTLDLTRIQPLTYPRGTTTHSRARHAPTPSRLPSVRDYSIQMGYSSKIPRNDTTLLPLANSELATGAVDDLAPLRDFRTHLQVAHAWSDPSAPRYEHHDLCVA